MSIATLIVSNLFYKKETKQFFDIAKHNFYKCNRQELNSLWLVTYGSGEVHQANQKALIISAIDKCIDAIKIYTPENLSRDFIEENKTIMMQKRGSGYWL